MPDVVMMVGMPGSGKTTYVKRNLPEYAHVSLDINKSALSQDGRGALIRRYESEDPLRLGAQGSQVVIPPNPAGSSGSLSSMQASGNRRAEYVQIADALASGRSVVIDDTNLTKEMRWPYIVLAKKYGAPVRCVSFLNLQLALDRNSARAGDERVPDKVMRNMCSMLEHPDESEGFDSISTIYG